MNTRQLTAFFFTVSSLFYIAHATASTLTQKDSTVIARLFSNTKPQCIGRYVIDVPGSFNNQLRDMVFIDDFKIESKPLYPPAFKQRVQLREQALRDAIKKPENNPMDAPYIKQIIDLPDDKGVIFDRNNPGSADSFRHFEAHVYVEGVAFLITTKILDLSADKYADEKKTYLDAGFSEAETNTRPAKLAALQSLISRLSGRKDDALPSGSGVCIPDGFIRDDGVNHREKVTFSYITDDFALGVYTNNTYAGSNDTLFNRKTEIDQILKVANQHTIKKYALSPGGIPSQVWLSGGMQPNRSREEKENDSIPLYEFDLYANEADATPARPWLTMGISNHDKKTRYSEAQMIEIWDRLVNSLRYK